MLGDCRVYRHHDAHLLADARDTRRDESYSGARHSIGVEETEAAIGNEHDVVADGGEMRRLTNEGGVPRDDAPHREELTQVPL